MRRCWSGGARARMGREWQKRLHGGASRREGAETLIVLCNGAGKDLFLTSCCVCTCIAVMACSRWFKLSGMRTSAALSGKPANEVDGRLE